MVAIFIDESGKFTSESLFNVVAAITLPHRSLGRARREIVRVSQGWPRVDGELKGVATYGRFRRFGVSTEEKIH